MSGHDEDRHGGPDPGQDWDRAAEAEIYAAAGADFADVDDDLLEAASVLVDGKDAQRRPRLSVAMLREGQRRPIIPTWLRSRDAVFGQVRWAAGYAAHTSAYHAVRVPKYAGRLAWRAPVGAGRLTTGLVRWAIDAEGIPVREATVRRADAETYLRLSHQRDDRVRARTITAGVVVVMVAVAVIAWCLAPTRAKVTTAAVVVAVLGVIGRPADCPLLDTAVVKARYRPITSAEIDHALSCIGLAGINQALSRNPRAIKHVAPIAREGSAGWRAEVDLPGGVTVGEVADRRAKLAAALGRPLGCVWPEGRPEIHPGRLVLFVGDQDMGSAKQGPWPLAKAGSVDLFAPVPFATDQRGRTVTVTLMFASTVIGSLPRMGKTFAMRLLALAAALDVRAQLHLYDLKGTGDFAALAPVAHRYRAGDDEDDIAYLLADARELAAEMRRRTKVIRELPRDLCPENKVTGDLADKPSLGLHPILALIDECQRAFEHPRHGKELTEIFEDLVKRGPAVGIIPAFGTQRPDAKSLPTGIAGNAVLRFCLKVMGQVENDMVLGTSMYQNGVRATMFSRRDRGIGYLAGEDDDPRIVRTYYLDGPAAERIVTRARAAREQAGRLSGHALGLAPAPAAGVGYDLLADIAAVTTGTEAKVWNETVLARLTELRPAVYTGWGPEGLTAALKPHGIAVGQVWGTDGASGKSHNRRGITRTHITDALSARPADKPTRPPTQRDRNDGPGSPGVDR